MLQIAQLSSPLKLLIQFLPTNISVNCHIKKYKVSSRVTIINVIQIVTFLDHSSQNYAANYIYNSEMALLQGSNTWKISLTRHLLHKSIKLSTKGIWVGEISQPVFYFLFLVSHHHTKETLLKKLISLEL